jgi:hypothetical protein
MALQYGDRAVTFGVSRGLARRIDEYREAYRETYRRERALGRRSPAPTTSNVIRLLVERGLDASAITSTSIAT